jgi:alkylhydroperoxidase family enzyme
MARISDLEGVRAGIIARTLHGIYRLSLGRNINPAKVLAHAPRALVSSFLSNAILGTGRPAIGRELAQLVRIRVAARNGCPF